MEKEETHFSERSTPSSESTTSNNWVQNVLKNKKEKEIDEKLADETFKLVQEFEIGRAHV